MVFWGGQGDRELRYKYIYPPGRPLPSAMKHVHEGSTVHWNNLTGPL
jgi:hypothetical protein